MRNPKTFLSIILALILCVSMLAGCGSTKPEATEAVPAVTEAAPTGTEAVSTEKQVIHMGSSGLYTSMVEILADMMSDKYDIQLVMVDSNSGCAEGAVYGDIDAFMYNHEPWLMQYNASNGTDFKVMNHLYYGRSALYSDKYETLEDLPDGATVAISNDSVNMENNLLFLESIGLITLGEKSAADSFLTTLDVTDNPKNIKFVEVEISYAVRSLDECDAAIVSSTSVLQAGKDPNKFLAENLAKVSYPIGLTILAEDENEQWVADIMEVEASEEFRTRFNEVYKGSLVLY